MEEGWIVALGLRVRVRWESDVWLAIEARALLGRNAWISW